MKIPYSTSRASLVGYADVAYVDEGEDPVEQVLAAAWQSIQTDVDITIGDVTMFAAAWADPDHWSEDWAKKLSVEWEDVPEAVAAIVTGVAQP